MVSVFTYGTLQVPAVMTAVTGKSFPSIDAVLQGYRRYKIRNRVYPAIIADQSASTSGVIYKDIDERSLALLDEFEDILYERTIVTVQTNAAPLRAHAYVIAAQYIDRLADVDWDLAAFNEQHLEAYLRRIVLG